MARGCVLIHPRHSPESYPSICLSLSYPTNYRTIWQVFCKVPCLPDAFRPHTFEL